MRLAARRHLTQGPETLLLIQRPLGATSTSTSWTAYLRGIGVRATTRPPPARAPVRLPRLDRSPVCHPGRRRPIRLLTSRQRSLLGALATNKTSSRNSLTSSCYCSSFKNQLDTQSATDCCNEYRTLLYLLFIIRIHINLYTHTNYHYISCRI